MIEMFRALLGSEDHDHIYQAIELIRALDQTDESLSLLSLWVDDKGEPTRALYDHLARYQNHKFGYLIAKVICCVRGDVELKLTSRSLQNDLDYLDLSHVERLELEVGQLQHVELISLAVPSLKSLSLYGPGLSDLTPLELRQLTHALPSTALTSIRLERLSTRALTELQHHPRLLQSLLEGRGGEGFMIPTLTRELAEAIVEEPEILSLIALNHLSRESFPILAESPLLLSAYAELMDERGYPCWRRFAEAQVAQLKSKRPLKRGLSAQLIEIGSHLPWSYSLLTPEAHQPDDRVSDPLVLLLCPPGEFMMGDPQDHPKNRSARPQHYVKISRAFWMARNRFTVEQFHQLADLAKRRGLADLHGDDEFSMFFSERRSRRGYGFSWYGAAKLCNLLSDLESLERVYEIPEYTNSMGRDGRYFNPPVDVNPDAAGYRLPTEAEWEYIAQMSERSHRWSVMELASKRPEWCQDTWSLNTYTSRGGLTIDPLIISDRWYLKKIDQQRVTRTGYVDGSAFNPHQRDHHKYTQGQYSVDFRPTRYALPQELGQSRERPDDA